MMPGKYLRVFFLLMIAILLFTSATFAVKLELGDRGLEVEKVQQYLFNLGYDITVDGIYGYHTREVVKDFQLSNGLTVDGIVGKETIALLEETAKDIKYTVKMGDTLSELALKFNTTVDDIKEANNLRSDLIKIGEELVIPKTGLGGGEEERLYATIHHQVQPGDALSLLAKKYGTDIQTIKLANNLHSDRIYVGDTLIIPHVKREVNRPFRLTRGALIWPVLGRISSGYGYRTNPINKTREFHEGIDIAVPLGTKIRAAAGGTVVQSGWVKGYGKAIVIDHGEGVRTLYAHNSRLLVRAGTRVELGQVIALAGSTGLSTGSHLHFSIYVNGKSVDPMRYLP
ncbi:MAG: hypothetical protein PWR10_198 [Halanaerobiales bacterium]|nr:hypothetical protein [Halanaerobiales bacterium]